MQFEHYTQSLQSSVQFCQTPVFKKSAQLRYSINSPKNSIDYSTALNSVMGSKSSLKSFPSIQKLRNQQSMQLTFAEEERSYRKRAISTTTEQLSKQLQCFKNIAFAVQAQNKNLHEQNQYLLKIIRTLQSKQQQSNNNNKQTQRQKMYKQLYRQALNEVSKFKQQKNVYRSQSKEMKNIALVEVKKLRNNLSNFIQSCKKEQNQGTAQRARLRIIEEQRQQKYNS